jgi:hypothetical protein
MRNKHLNTDPLQTTSYKTIQTPKPLKLSTHKLILPNMLLIKGTEESYSLILLPLGLEPHRRDHSKGEKGWTQSADSTIEGASSIELEKWDDEISLF